jgi:hypothetical protein
MNFSFVGFRVTGKEGRCISHPQAGEYNMITNKKMLGGDDWWRGTAPFHGFC